ncbi:DUF3995 domain-containing protein [Ensifer sp. LC163]|uniref:DUF3995 domain-containing protein n=1 Tax=Ensifer sp. LC163 TaxID=1120652 RepID=UPI0008138988|nr:DUF3995 domain-containing protein [Ensifer sp. LC163]OCP36882.1 hypothetical protein BC360_05950 [Ensifer sp. LC163]
MVSLVSASAICLVLSVIAVLHAYWAWGGLWPGHDEASLAKTVVGASGLETMPPAGLTVLVAILIFVAGLLPLIFVSGVPSILPASLVWMGMVLLAAIFLVRGVLAFTPIFRGRHPQQPFATLDRRFYGPLCLVIGIGYVLVLALA